MKSTDEVGITFAHLVLGRGVLNAVVNVTLGSMHFSPENGKIENDPRVVCRLRMDIPCAMSLRDALTELIATMSAPSVPQLDAASTDAANASTEGKPN